MFEGLRQAILHDANLKPDLLVMWPIPEKGDPWGVLAPLRGSSWGDQIPIISGEMWTYALHGHTHPLRQKLGSPPVVRAKRLPVVDRECSDFKCALRTELCLPGSGKLPNCYQSPWREMHRLTYALATAWDEGRYVVVVSGLEFVI